MAENVLSNEQEQHIIINNDVREDGTLINNKNKVDFTIGNNQLRDSNTNKVGGSSKSFFRMDSTYGPRSYDRSTKLFPCSQSQPDQHKEVAPDDFHKNQCVINARERLKCIEDCKNIIDHARKIKSLNQT